MTDPDDKGDEKADTLRVVAESEEGAQLPDASPTPAVTETATAPRRPWWTWPAVLLGAATLLLAAAVALRFAEAAPVAPPPAAGTVAVALPAPEDGGAPDAGPAEPDAVVAVEPLPSASEEDDDAGADAGDGADAGEDAAADGGHDAGAVLGPTARTHMQEGALHWRVSRGGDRVAETRERGGAFEVVLRPGATFDGVQVEWQDASGHWHVH